VNDYDNDQSWFHCGRCGSLFLAEPGDVDDRLCTTCGLNPSLGIETKLTDRSTPKIGGLPEPIDPEKGSRRNRKRNNLLVKLITVWIAFVVLIILGARKIWPEQFNQKVFVSKAQATAKVAGADNVLLAEAGPLINQSFSGFISSGTPEVRAQFVFNPINVTTRMARFYELNPQVTIAPESLTLSHTSTLNIPKGRAIETIWQTTDGKKIDAVFLEQDKEWRLDWEHFARYSTYPWTLFLAGSGDPDGEFRLLARQRLAEQRKNADTISIVLYAPRFGAPEATLTQSPEFLIKRDTKNGRMLGAAFQMEKSGQRIFGANTPNLNPEGLIRVRVKVRRFDDKGERRFEITEVVACHWYTVDAPGVDIPQPPVEK